MFTNNNTVVPLYFAHDSRQEKIAICPKMHDISKLLKKN